MNDLHTVAAKFEVQWFRVSQETEEQSEYTHRVSCHSVQRRTNIGQEVAGIPWLVVQLSGNSLITDQLGDEQGSTYEENGIEVWAYSCIQEVVGEGLFGDGTRYSDEVVSQQVGKAPTKACSYYNLSSGLVVGGISVSYLESLRQYKIESSNVKEAKPGFENMVHPVNY